MIVRKIIIAIFLLYLPLHSQTQTGQVVVPTGELLIKVVASETTDFIKSWMSTSPKVKPYIKGVREVTPNQTFYVAFLVSGFKSDIKRHYNFIVHWKLYRPDGSIMFDQKNSASGKGIMPDKPMFVMADPTLDLYLDNTDPIGTYRIVGIVEDIVDNTKCESDYKFDLVKTKNYGSLSNVESDNSLKPASNAAELDSLWNVFYTTEEPKSLVRIFKSLIYCLERNDIDLFSIGSAAKYSFILFGKKDTRLSQFLKSIFDESPIEMKNEIDDIIAKIADKEGLAKNKKETSDIIAIIVKNNRKK